MTDVQLGATSTDAETDESLSDDLDAPALSTERALPNLDTAAIDFAKLPESAPRAFKDFPVSDDIKDALTDMGYTDPTPVQCGVVTDAANGLDLVVQSKTGSGKTAAFGIPLLHRIDAGKGNPGHPRALIVVPTRELAHQVAAELRQLSVRKGTRVLAIYGGVPMGRQIAVLNSGVDIIVGTPGRLLDHIRRKNLSLSELDTFVLDEADEMLSMGFWDDVTAMLGMAPKTRQTMLFSATLPYEVAKAASTYLRNPVRVDLSGDTLSVDGIENHIFHVVPTMSKPRQLLYVLEREQPESAIIFCNTRNETEMIAKFLTTSGFIAEPLSGNLKQKERERVMGRIKAKELRFMVATDIAARGIDITNLSHVVNYSLPEFTEVFLHRVGRTGRIGKKGTAVSLVDGMGLGTLTKLEREFGIKFTEQKLPPEEEAIALRSKRIMKDLTEKASVAEVGQHVSAAQEILGSPEASQVIAYLLKSYFGNTAADAERRSRTDQNDRDGRERDRENAPRPSSRSSESREGGRSESSRSEGSRSEGSRSEGTRSGVSSAERRPAEPRPEGASASTAEGEGGRRRRRRRRGRGRGERGEGGGPFMETLDAAEMLARDPSNPNPPPKADSDSAGESGHRERERERERDRDRDSHSNGASQVSTTAALEVVEEGFKRMRVNIGFDDGFKGKGAVAKKIASLAGLNEGIVLEVEARRDHAVLKATPEIAELVLERVDGATIGKKVVVINVAGQ